MLICVLDDSGSNQQGEAFVLAGYVASASAWDTLSAHWQEALNKEPKLKYFKMREAAALRDQFDGWSGAQRDERVMEFVTIIRDSRPLVGLTSAIFWEDLNRISAEFPEVPLPAYDLLFHGSMAVLHNYCRRHGVTEKIDFVFDEQGSWSKRTGRSYTYAEQIFTDEERSLLGNRPVHRDDREFLPLQAADLIAWQTRRFIEDNKHVDPLAPVEAFNVNSAALRELEKIETLYNTYGLDRLRTIAQDWVRARKELGDKPDIRAVRKWHKS